MIESLPTYIEEPPSGKARDFFLAPLSQKHRARRGFSKLPPIWRTVIAHSISTRDGTLTYIKNSKAACTTVAQLIYREGFREPFDGDIHHAPLGYLSPGLDWREMLNRFEKGPSFSIVRNPEARAVSGFFDFFVRARNPGAEKHRKYAEAFGLYSGSDLSTRFDSFLDYVSVSLERSPLETDRHFRPQHINLGHGHFTLTHVGKVESPTEDLERIGRDTGVRLVWERMETVARTNSTKSDTFAVSPAQRKRIQKLFASDYELYGY